MGSEMCIRDSAKSGVSLLGWTKEWIGVGVEMLDEMEGEGGACTMTYVSERFLDLCLIFLKMLIPFLDRRGAKRWK